VTVGHIGATSDRKITDSSGQWRSAKAAGQHRFSGRITGHPSIRVLSDTEEVTGSNPVAPTTILAGQRPVSPKRNALLTYRGRTAAAGCSPLNRVGPPEPDDGDHHQRNDHAAWSPPSGPAHGRASVGNLPRAHLRGPGSICSLPAPANRPAPGAGPAPWSASGERGAAACTHAKRRTRSAVDPRASHARPTFDHPVPARPDPSSDDQAAHRPQRHVQPGTARCQRRDLGGEASGSADPGVGRRRGAGAQPATCCGGSH
jgi:hypothetical protein